MERIFLVQKGAEPVPHDSVLVDDQNMSLATHGHYPPPAAIYARLAKQSRSDLHHWERGRLVGGNFGRIARIALEHAEERTNATASR